jgi:hypothetical protein
MLEVSIGYIRCYRFDPKANDVPAGDNVLEQYRAICLPLTQEPGRWRFVQYGEHPWPGIQFQSVDDSDNDGIDMWPAYIEYYFRNPPIPGDLFTPYGSNPPPKPREDMLELLFDLCRCGDLSVLLPGVVLLTDSQQSSRMPKSWGHKRCELMDSRKEFVRLLMGTYHGCIPAKLPPENYFPGLFIEKGRYVYIEAGKKDTSSKHFKAICNTRTPDAVLGSGGIMPEEAQIITPDGTKFYCYRAAGFGFEPFLRSAATKLERMYGTIINFETFRRSDGVEYDISECDLKTKIEPNAGKVPKSQLAVTTPKKVKSGWVINEVELSSNLRKLEAGELELESVHYEYPEERSLTAIQSDCRKSFKKLREDFTKQFGPSIRSGTEDDSGIPLNGVFMFEVWKTGFGEMFLAASHEDRSLPVVLAFGKLRA